MYARGALLAVLAVGAAVGNNDRDEYMFSLGSTSHRAAGRHANFGSFTTPTPTAIPTHGPTPAPIKEETNGLTPPAVVATALMDGPLEPTDRPTPAPAAQETDGPTPTPTDGPTPKPTPAPLAKETDGSTLEPTPAPGAKETDGSTPEPTVRPTHGPMPAPVKEETDGPSTPEMDGSTPEPTDRPTPTPVAKETDEPTPAPTALPTPGPTQNTPRAVQTSAARTSTLPLPLPSTPAPAPATTTTETTATYVEPTPGPAPESSSTTTTAPGSRTTAPYVEPTTTTAPDCPPPGSCRELGVPQRSECPPDATYLPWCNSIDLTPGSFCVADACICPALPISDCPAVYVADRRLSAPLGHGPDAAIFIVPQTTPAGPTQVGNAGVILTDAADALISPSQTTSARGEYSYSYDPVPTMAPTTETMMPTATMAPTRTETYAPTRMTEAPSYAPTTDTYAPTSTPSVTGAPTSVSPVPTPAPVPRGNLRA